MGCAGVWDSLTVGSVGQGIRRPAQQGEGGAPQEDDEELKELHDAHILFLVEPDRYYQNS